MDLSLILAEPGQACSACGEIPKPSAPGLMRLRGSTKFEAFFCCPCTIEFFIAIGMTIREAVATIEHLGETVH